MIEALSGYYILFTVIFTFAFTFLQDKYADVLISHISKYRFSRYSSKMVNAALSLYSKSDIETNCKWLRIVLLLLVMFCALLAYIKIPILDILSPTIFSIFLIIISPNLFKDSLDRLLRFSNKDVFFVMTMTLMYILLLDSDLLLSQRLHDYNTIMKYIIPAVTILITVKVVPVIVSGFVLTIIKCTKLFAMILLKHENPLQYIAKYVLITISSYFISLVASLFIVWAKCAIIEGYSNYINTILLLQPITPTN